jgi:hypothetical protein
MTTHSAEIRVKKCLIAIQTLAAADIAAKLYVAQNSAARLSLTAKNLSVIAARIGLDAAGLKVLSSFYDQFAQKAIKLAKEINFLAQRISRNTMARWRNQLLLTKVDAVLKRKHRPQVLLERNYQEVQRKAMLLHHGSNALCEQLERLLAELLDSMMTMQVIAVNARIEACSLLSHQLQLSQLSLSIEAHSTSIRVDIQHCQSRLKELLTE